MKKVTALILIFIILLTAAAPLCIASAGSRPFYFLEENESRYESFHEKNPRIPYDKALAYVNANVDKGFYRDIVTVANPNSINVLTNKNFALPAGFEPGDLVTFLGGHRMRREAAEHLLDMRNEMFGQGYRMTVVVGYRSYGTQVNSFNNAVARFGTVNADVSFARPGHSEHQTGLAVDLLHIGGFDYMQNSYFEKTREFEWLRENAHKYGFILRYPEGYRDIHGFIFEPWHWRYVGVFAATLMYNEGIDLLEEYYGRYLSTGVFRRTKVGSRSASTIQWPLFVEK